MTSTEDDPLLGQRVMAADLRDAWAVLDAEARVEGFRYLTTAEAEEFFYELGSLDRAQLVLNLPAIEQRWWLRGLAPDDVADLVQATPHEERGKLLALLDDATRKEIGALLAYSEDEAGGLMNPRYARLRPDASVDEAISYLRRQTRERVESIYYAYVLDEQQKLVGVVSFRQLMMARGDARVREVMVTDLLTVQDEMDQEAVARVFATHNLMCIPVLDAEGRMKGIVTADDIVDVVREAASGLALGGLLAAVGFTRIVIWQFSFHNHEDPTQGYYGKYYLNIAAAVTMSVVAIATWGTLAGSLLPFLLKRVGFDPASASAPLVATLVDVTGLVIYFTTASMILSGTLL